MIMINEKIGEIILCSGIKMDKNYENVLSYNEENMVSLCRSNAIYTGYNYSLIQPDTIKIAIPYKDAIYTNYIAFINPNYGNKWFFGWVENIRLVNPKVTEIRFKVDVFSTWFTRFELNQAFIEREHVTDDLPGKHTIPESLEIGDYVCDNIIKQKGLSNVGGYIILSSTFVPYLDQNDELIISTPGDGGNAYNGIYSGLEYTAFSNSTAGRAKLKKVIEAYAKAGRNDDINGLFIAPLMLLSEIDFEETGVWGVVKQSSEAYTYAWESYDTDQILKPTTLDGYTPVNKKLLQFPYCYINMNNGNGGSALYKYELFKNQENFCDFSIAYSISPGMSTLLRPHYYESTETFNHKADLIGGKYPTCNWLSDTYTNWLTQNALNIKLGIVGYSAEAGLGGFEMGAFPGQGAQNLLSGIGGIANLMKEVYLKREFTSPQAEGNVNCGDVNFSSSNTTFTCYQMSIKEEYARIIDQYFSRFGYKVNTVKVPNLNSRQVFNYLKVGGLDELVHGNIPESDLEEINSIFRKGVTIFHSYNNIGNYTISNPNVN